MKPNELRELDAWIAEHVMGHEVGYGEILTVEPDRNGEPNITDHQPIPEYTADPAAAMVVLERCSEFENNIQIWRGTNDMHCDFSKHWFVHMNKLGPICYTNAPTLPLAICLFAKQLYSQGKNSEENKL